MIKLSKINELFKAYVLMFFAMSIVLAIHYYILHFFVNATFYVLRSSYILNYILFCLVLLLFYWLRRKGQTENLGYVFMWTSFLKFLIFYLVFKTELIFCMKSSKIELHSIFTPYFMTLICEVFFVSKLIRK